MSEPSLRPEPGEPCPRGCGYAWPDACPDCAERGLWSRGAMSEPSLRSTAHVCHWCDKPATNGASGEARIGGTLRRVEIAACDDHAAKIAPHLVAALGGTVTRV